MKRQRIRVLAITLVAVFAQQVLPFALEENGGEGLTGVPVSQSSALQTLPQVTLWLSGLEESEYLLYAGVDLAVLEEHEAGENHPDDQNSDGKVYKVKEGKVQRFLTRSTSITVDLGGEADYQKGIRHKLAMRTLYFPLTGSEVIIADQSNGKDGWVILPDSEFILSYFVEDDGGLNMVKHTEKWEENRQRYNHVTSGTNGTNAQEARPYHMFWSGEMLVLTIRTKERIGSKDGLETYEGRCGIEVVLSEQAEGVWKNPYPALWLETCTEEVGTSTEDTKTYTYQGYLWQEDMIHKWGNDKPELLKITATPLIDGQPLHEDVKEETIIMDNRDLFFRIHQK